MKLIRTVELILLNLKPKDQSPYQPQYELYVSVVDVYLFVTKKKLISRILMVGKGGGRGGEGEKRVGKNRGSEIPEKG